MFELLDSVKKNNFMIKSIRSKADKRGLAKSKDQRQNKAPKSEAISVKAEERERVFMR